jgi:hypothetical protein
LYFSFDRPDRRRCIMETLACPKTAARALFTARHSGRIMHCLGRAAIVALSVLTLTQARAEGLARPPHPVVHPPHACLDQRERQAEIQSGKVVHLAAAIRAAKKRMPGSVVRARLCRGKNGLFYVLTILARDGKVARLKVDAVKGTLVGER